MKVGAGCALEAVIGPEGLGAVGGFDGGLALGWEGLLAMGAGEGDVVGGVPVLGCDDVLEALGEGIDAGEEVECAFDLERRAGEHEVVLHVDDEESVARGEVHASILWRVGLAA